MHTTRRLSRSQLRDIKAELERERTRLERSLASSAAADGGGASSMASAAFAPGFGADLDAGVALLSQALTRHEAITEALRRLDAGAYGDCTDCRNPIPFGRLLVMPETTHCVACGARA